MMMVVVVVVLQVVVVHTQLTEPMMMMGMMIIVLLQVVVIVHGRSSGSRRRRSQVVLLLLLQLSRVLDDIVLLGWVLRLRKKRQRSGLRLELEQVVMMVGMGVVLELVALQERQGIQSIGEEELGLWLWLGLLRLL